MLFKGVTEESRALLLHRIGEGKVVAGPQRLLDRGVANSEPF